MRFGIQSCLASLLALVMLLAASTDLLAQCGTCNDGGCSSCMAGLVQDAPSCCGSSSCTSVRCRDCYFSMFGGFVEVDDYNFVGPATFEGSLDNGWGIGAAFGKTIASNIRGEMEFAYRAADGADWIVNGNSGSWSGNLTLFTLMTNVLVDLPQLSIGRITPYVGGGIGLGIFGSDMTTGAGALDIDGPELAYQLIAGGSYPLTDRVDFIGEYRYLGTTDVEIVNGAGTVIGEESPQLHSGFFGVRIYR